MDEIFRDRRQNYQRLVEMQAAALRLGHIISAAGIRERCDFTDPRRNNGWLLLISSGLLGGGWFYSEMVSKLPVTLALTPVLMLWGSLRYTRFKVIKSVKYYLHRPVLELMFAEIKSLSFLLWGFSKVYIPLPGTNCELDERFEAKIRADFEAEERFDSGKWGLRIPAMEYISNYPWQIEKGARFSVEKSFVWVSLHFGEEDRVPPSGWKESPADYIMDATLYFEPVPNEYERIGSVERLLNPVTFPRTVKALQEFIVRERIKTRKIAA